MPSRDTSRLRDRRGTPQKEPEQANGGKVAVAKKERTFMDQWVEPSLASQPSYQDHHGAPYGVLEHMQPLGEAPNAKVKSRVRSDAPRKSVMGRSSAAAGLEAQETPEGTPTPQAAPTLQPSEPAPPAPPVVDDERDDDYAPVPKKKGPAKTLRTTQRRSDAAAPAPGRVEAGSSSRGKGQPATGKVKGRIYDPPKMKRVVEAAKSRAIEVGKPDLAAAVHEIWLESLNNSRLTDLLESILMQKASTSQTHEFQGYVKRAKRRLKEAKEKARSGSAASTNGAQALPLRSPSATKLLPTPSAQPLTSALPSTEPLDTTRPKPTIKLKSPAKSINGRHKTGQGSTMMDSPAKSRTRAGSESSELTDLTSEGGDAVDADDQDDLGEGPPPMSASTNGLRGKDHAAERGSLVAPDRKLKRSSAEADFEDAEQEAITAKKQKLSQTVTREVPHEESDMRETPRAAASTQRRAGATKESRLAPPSLRLNPNGSRPAGLRGSRDPSMDLDSPLSELSPASSRMSTPRVLKMPRLPPSKRAKTKTSPEKKHLAGYGGLSGAGGAGRESPIGDDDNEELSENNDFCSACGGSGFLLCCDGCDRSFHFACLDPPLNEDASELNEPWYCFICVAKRPVTTEPTDKPQRGLFAPLLTSLRKLNPATFTLPQEVRDYFEGVQTDRHGHFIEAVNGKTRNRAGYDELPDYYKLKDSKGNTVLCYQCNQSSQPSQGQPARSIVQCDYCGENWHLDCLDPPLANPPARSWDGKKIHDWMCPLHADQELRTVDASMLVPRRRLHVRRPRNARVIDVSLNRGFKNNGVVDVIEDDSDETDSEFYDDETQEEGVVYRMPAHGIKLDFIDKIKNSRYQATRDHALQDHPDKRARLSTHHPPSALQQANFARRPFAEQQLALNLAQFASANQDLDLGSDQVENLIGTLIAEAPTEIVDDYTAVTVAVEGKIDVPAVPLSPPTSEQTDQLSAEQRKQLLELQELIRRKLESSKT
ncbi:hypothetical protein LTR78_005670 [Recurvomyces mirabilis]|uniref:PHD-type domain-containing protein n=1 Tax=Recurvomyces mirabilis TaxID=574656 RepID=A0AAE0WMQ9_9PEZI|nr:hypothetical protein LTR78_005670 [Recurvomyces mirabilis]KAK5151207.1 hypothetical protein LTS14_009377 [Recurvomyces mirabilis]